MAKVNNTKSNTSKNSNNMNTTNLICPNCGAHFALPEHEHHVEGTALAKDSNRGDIYLTLDGNSSAVLPVTVDTQSTYNKHRKGKAERAIEALKRKGYDTSKFHALNFGGSSIVGVDTKDGIAPVDYDSPIFDGVDIEGTVSNPYLFRRWIVSQLAHMEFIGSVRWYSDAKPRGVHKELQAKGYEYSWRVIINELKAQARMERQGDLDELAKRNRWYDKYVIVCFLKHYYQSLKDYFDSLAKKHCKGREYIKPYGINIFTDRLDEIIFAPLRKRIEDFDKCNTAASMYKAVSDFRKLDFKTDGRKYKSYEFHLHSDTKMCKEFMDAYKGCGAYYAFDNMIKFMDCVITTKEGVTLDKEQSLKYLESKAAELSQYVMGYKFLGMWKRFVRDNGIDFNAKVAEWRRAREEKRANR